jgi:hypothetical protein
MFRVLFVLLFVWLTLLGKSQISVKLLFDPVIETSIQDSSHLEKLIQEEILKKRGAGYVTCGVDSIKYAENEIIVYVYQGQEYSYITSGIEYDGYIKKNEFSGNPINFKDYTRNILSNFENNGFPFVTIKVEVADVINDSVVLDLQIDPKNYIVFDTFLFVNETKLSKKYLSRYLGIIPGKPYDESKVKDIYQNLNNLPFIKVKKSTEIFFTRNLARLVFYFEDVSNDQLDGVIGLAPNSDNNPNADLMLTGELNLDFQNLFGAGRQFALNWRNYLQRSQKLMVAGAVPYLFGTKLGISGSFLVNKFDTFFVTNERKIGVDFRYKGNSFVGFYYKVEGSSLISVDTSTIRATRRLPNNNPFRVNSYGFQLFHSKLDFFQNPRRGIVVRSDFSVGTRTVLRDSRIDQVVFLNTDRPEGFTLYDTLSVGKNLRGRLDLSAEFYIPIGKSSTFYNRIVGAALIAPNIAFNEYFNYGGFSTLRGFDELALFARRYVLHNIEYRYLINANSFVGAFVNYSYLQNDFNQQFQTDIPIGFGFAGRIGVGKGQLNIAYALGRQGDNPLNFSSGKIHFGYINYL